MATHSQKQLPAFLRRSRYDHHTRFVDLEWQQRNRLLQGSQQPVDSNGPPSQFARLTGDAIMSRNRYLNVEPFAQNRVKLRVAPGVNDYINASPIQLGKRKYIATQGPKDISINHFYRMVASELKSPAVVVMLTQTHEAGRERCCQYYPLSPATSPLVISPDEASADGFRGEVELVNIEDHVKTRSEIRRLRLRTMADDGGLQEVEIHHLLFAGWPDFLVPEGADRQALVELVRLSASINRASSSHASTHSNGSSLASDLASADQDNPRIVHCSAGVGRSGTFIALDYLLSLLYSGQLDDVPADQDPVTETVDQMRQQRMMMVQSEAQFNFIYDVLREHYVTRMREMAVNGGGVGEQQN